MRNDEVINVHDELYNKYYSGRILGISWGDFLEASYEWSLFMRNYSRAYIIATLIRFNVDNAGPHTREELSVLLTALA